MSSLRNSYEEITNPPSAEITGWGFYRDSLSATDGANTPQVIPDGTTTAILNNKNQLVLENQLPIDAPQAFTFWDTSRIRPITLNDAMLISFRFEVYANINNGGFSVDLDISAAGDGSNVIVGKSFRLIRGSGAANAQVYSVDFTVFCGSSFITNGGLPRITAEDGDISLMNVNFFIERSHKGRVG